MYESIHQAVITFEQCLTIAAVAVLVAVPFAIIGYELGTKRRMP